MKRSTLGGGIEHAKRTAKRIYIVDSFSTDRTCEGAEECGVVVLKNKYVNYAQQFQWTLDNCKIDTEWTMRLDADEYLSEELEKDLEERLPQLDNNVTGVYLRLEVIFLEHLLKHDYIKDVTILRLWRTGSAYVEQRWMVEHPRTFLS